MRRNIWLNYLLVYFVWTIVLALGIWLLLLSHTAFLNVAALYAQDSLERAWQIRSLEKFSILGMGLVCLIIMIVSEFYFRHGARRGYLFQRFARILGTEMLLLFVVDAVLLAAQGLRSGIWSRWLILGAELVLGIVLRVFARPSPSIMSDLKYADQDSV